MTSPMFFWDSLWVTGVNGEGEDKSWQVTVEPFETRAAFVEEEIWSAIGCLFLSSSQGKGEEGGLEGSFNRTG